MNLLSFLKVRQTAPLARERLQLIIAHERAEVGRSQLVDILREEILAVIAKHIAIDRDKVQVRVEQGQEVSTLDLDIELPVNFNAKKAA
ncbi:cell division topological specificity factor MinE [Methylobacterium planeticum]|uniref:Cell division topological specificity factor n=1 Tax=Methylobacterium planeticum TaxID=2615211 RepID=A0A6N6MP73_9HYPH|nr:cell division topological specificity factor MinE [Methylobacterium planeticum]KAB1072747.1 cell division topological specificity factor MinE [Methylobacterium planeticum]